MEIKATLESLKSAVDTVISRKLDLRNIDASKLRDYKQKQAEHYKGLIESSLSKLQGQAFDLAKLKSKAFDEVHDVIIEMDARYRRSDLKTLSELSSKAIKLIPEKMEEMKDISFKIPKLPSEIRADVAADILEMQKCYKQELFRSAAILCGRILEVALHRKYFEVTGNDILEKHPEIGLGNLIAKLVEKGVHFDPGLTQQIHLINQVRVHSVHKKQEAFLPSKMQTQAMILYTMDSLEKLFR